MKIEEIRKRREELDGKSEKLRLKQARLRGEYQALQSICHHPGLRLGTDIGGGPDGRCAHCGKCW